MNIDGFEIKYVYLGAVGRMSELKRKGNAKYLNNILIICLSEIGGYLLSGGEHRIQFLSGSITRRAKRRNNYFENLIKNRLSKKTIPR